MRQLAAARAFPAPIVTMIVPLQQLYPAEAYHQILLALHPNQPCIVT
ncbi:MAG: peptide-methionine (S)-S-oxide reductase [Sulfurimicrobium sp.]|nr:peptide-methionine (S)-S-oxide reductase [Sulfurimicrobium sp.]MDP2963912.1 peptide-methionine (S)-S-oxide reductase [Sulfurimicrobium sp.]MDZ7654498.1 peptide-methionine (S)-S-oxide reductase [Sulfurimicrobium sp.]